MTPDAIRFREVSTPEGFSALLPLFREALAESPVSDGGVPDPDAAARVVVASLGDRACLVLVADAETEPAGLLVALPWSDPFLSTSGCRLRLWYVRPPRRRGGLGGRLAARAEQILRARGVGTLLLDLPTQDDALLSIVERHGWARVREWLEKDLD